jgi:hypothetical protein
MEDIVKALNYVLTRSSQRLNKYIETNNSRYMEECRIYLDVANIYMYNLSKKEESTKT